MAAIVGIKASLELGLKTTANLDRARAQKAKDLGLKPRHADTMSTICGISGLLYKCDLNCR